MIIKYFSKLKPSLSTKLFYIYMSVVVIYRLIFKTIYGGLLLSAALYLYVDKFTETEPFNGLQLLDWFVSLDTEFKTAILVSIVTISGFVIAFYTATLSWQNQMRANFMLEISKEMDDFFSKVIRSNIIAILHVKDMLRVVNKIKEQSVTLEEAEFMVDYNVSGSAKFVEARESLVNDSTKICSLIDHNYIILASKLGAIDHASASSSALNDIVQKIYIHLPYVTPGDPNRVNQFVDQVDVDKCTELVNICEKSETIISAAAGALRGQLQHKIIGYNAILIMHVFKMRKNMRIFAEDMYK